MAEELHFENPAAAAQDPSTDAESLRQLAYRYPELRPVVAAHPHAYRGLLEWLHQFNDPQVNAALEARDDYDGYIDSNGCLVMRGDVSGAVAGSTIRTSESGMYVLGQGGVDSYSQIERTTPYSAVAGKNSPVPQVDKREQVVAQVQRQSIMGSKASQDPEATAVYPSPVTSSSYPAAASSATASSSTESTAQIPRAYMPTPAARQPAQAAQPAAATAPSGRRSFPMMTIVLVSLGVVAAILLGIVIFVFTRGYEGPTGGLSPMSSASPSESPKPSASATTTEAVKYPAPAGAVKVDSFTMPSRNITCSFADDGVTCGIAESNWAEEGYASCSGGKVGVLKATKDSATQSCESSMPSGGETVAHGVAAAKGDYACRSTSDGVTCWNTRSGKSFALARAGWMTGTNGEITPANFAWNQ